MARTGLVYRKECLGHDPGPYHPERPERLDAILAALMKAGVAPIMIPCEPVRREDLLRVHSEAHIATVERTCTEGLAYADPDTRMSKGSWMAALLAAGGAIAACSAVVEGRVDNAFCAIRPPGHHAERDQARGFCLFNNIAVAARRLLSDKQAGRIAIVDWDVHHGNGTQQAFHDDERVYYASIHQHPLYPGTGMPDERGAKGTNLNVQMPPGAGPARWLDALGKRVVPEIEKFGPDFLLISAGFDAHRLDPLASQMLEAETFGEMTRMVRGLAGGRVVSLLEGGYHLDALGQSAAAHVKALQGE